MEDRVVKIVQEILNVADVKIDEPLSNYGLNSMQSMQLIFRLESTLGVQFDDEDLLIQNFSTISLICQMLETKLRSTRA